MPSNWVRICKCTVAESKLYMNRPSNLLSHELATCPACGLLCDDVQPKKTNCSKGKVFFQQSIGSNQPKIKGKNASLTEAILAIANILKHSKQPMFSGLSTDVEGFRALDQLSQKTNATFEHMNHASTGRNMAALQATGWQTTTLTEVKNRADTILCIGTDIVSHNPRFFERFVWTKNAMFIKPKMREIVYLGGKDLDTSHGDSSALKAPSVLPCKVRQLPEVLAALHAILLGKSLKVRKVAGIAVADLKALANKLQTSKYAVLTWVAKDLDFQNAELAIGQITQIVATLNQTTRAAGLPLGGSDGDTSTNYTNAWLNGQILKTEETSPDAVVWVNSFNAEKLPQKTSEPLIVLGNANSQLKQTPDVFIPIATPGLDCAGTLFRVDGSVTLPLKKIRESDLPTLPEVIRQIEAALK
jgi:formylmethanofuran dehydrogenase subunit B